MLGRALGREFPEAERFTRAALDITDSVALRGALAPDTRLVLNAAADTRVDAAETDPHHVVVNVVAVGALAALCRKLDATLVHVSTDYVFSGKGIRPYREDDPVDPINAYGRAKLMGERRAFAADVARAIRQLLEKRVTGVVHFANAGEATWHELASEAIVPEGHADVRVKAVSTSEFPRPARRPRWSVLDTSLYERITGGAPRSWREALGDYLAERRAAAPARPAP